jgi:HPt (histidine-containing phosphotransfer) domain-containing protein
MQYQKSPYVTFDESALDTLLEVIGGDRSNLLELIDSFIAEMPSLLAEMTAAAARGEASALGRTAHTMKSSARDFGALALAELCRRLEEQCRSGQPEDPNLQVAAIALELERARTALIQTRNGYVTGAE